MTLTEFLLARIAEDEARVDHYHRLLCMRTACDCLWGEDEEDLKEQERVCTCGYPARLRAEIEAKRQILKAHRPLREVESVEELTYPEAADTCVACCAGDHWSVRELDSKWLNGWCSTKAILASTYADHPDYLPEWKPQALTE